MAVTIHRMPAEARPRERLFQVGAAALSEAELLAIVIGSGRRGASALEVANEILGEHLSLDALAIAKPEELRRIPAVGTAKAAGIIAALELGRRAALGPPSASTRITNPLDLATAVRPHLGDLGREEAFLVALSLRNRLIKVERIATGEQGRCRIDIREVLASAIRLDSAAFGLAHTHPSGDPSPSAEDKEFTRLLAEAADKVGLRFVDHVIIAGSKWTSLVEASS